MHFLVRNATSASTKPDPVIAGLTIETTASVPVSSVSLNKSSLNLKAGEQEALTATVLPENASNKSVAWNSDNTDVATVDSSGKVTAVKAGTATITATAGGKSASCTVTVASEASIPVEKVTLSKDSLSLKVGESETLAATVAPENATDKAVTWKSSDTGVATVNGSGKVDAIKAGTATITATAGGKSASCTVTVTPASNPVVNVTSVKLNKTALSLKVGQSQTLTATVEPANATNRDVTWKSNNDAVASVKNGKVAAKAKGTATITAAAGGKTATCKVTVKAADIAVKSVKLNTSKITLGVRESFTLKATVKPSNATNKKVTWKSSKSSTVKVKNGKITALKAGSAKITATAGGKKATCTVTVKKAPTGIKLNKSSKTLKKSKTFQIKVTMKPKSSASYKMSYTSSNTKVAKVSSKGKITALRKGKATITVKTFNKKTAKIKITVK